MPSYQYRKTHCGDKTILRPSYLHSGISYTGKVTSLYWIGARLFSWFLTSPGHCQQWCSGMSLLSHHQFSLEQSHWAPTHGWGWDMGCLLCAINYCVQMIIKAGSWFSIKISFYQYKKSHCGDKTVVRSSYLHSGISYTGNMTSLYCWIRALFLFCLQKLTGFTVH